MPAPMDSYAKRLAALPPTHPTGGADAAADASDFAGRVARMRAAVETGDLATIRAATIPMGHLPDLPVVNEAVAREMRAAGTTPPGFDARPPNPTLVRVADADLAEVAMRHRDGVKARIPDDRLATHERLQVRREDVAAALDIPFGAVGASRIGTMLANAGDSVIFSSTGRGAGEGRPAIPAGELRGREALEALSQGFGSRAVTRTLEVESMMTEALKACPGLRRHLGEGLAALRAQTLGIDVGTMVAERKIAAGAFRRPEAAVGVGD